MTSEVKEVEIFVKNDDGSISTKKVVAKVITITVQDFITIYRKYEVKGE
jgi:hypothetical protein